MSARPGEWRLLEHDGDPVPGDPTTVGDEASHYATVASAISDQAGRLRRLAVPDAAMSGHYADALLIRMHNLAEDLSVMHRRFEVTATQLARLEPALQTARVRTQAALDDAVEAKSAIDANKPSRPSPRGSGPLTESEIDAERLARRPMVRVRTRSTRLAELAALPWTPSMTWLTRLPEGSLPHPTTN